MGNEASTGGGSSRSHKPQRNCTGWMSDTSHSHDAATPATLATPGVPFSQPSRSSNQRRDHILVQSKAGAATSRQIANSVVEDRRAQRSAAPKTLRRFTTEGMCPSGATNARPKKLCCDKCDGPHLTDECPIFKKPREKHPDAQRRSAKDLATSGGDNFVVKNARVVRQPGDGCCLFHSMAYGLGTNSRTLRAEISSFVGKNPKLLISDTALEDWVKWDAASTVPAYAKRMSREGCWGGGIEMAACSHLKKVNIHVYEANNRRSGGGYKRIAQFNHRGARKTVSVFYQGGMHFDALVV